MTTATGTQYAAAAIAVNTVVQKKITTVVPLEFRGMIPKDQLQQFIVEAARAAVDAALAAS